MRTLVFFICFAIGSGSTWAQKEPEETTPSSEAIISSSEMPISPSQELVHSAKTARQMRNTGIALSVVGGAMAGTGGSLVGAYFHNTRSGDFVLGGSILLGLGMPTLLVGIPLAAVGGWTDRKLRDPTLDVESAVRTARRIRNAGIGVTAAAIAGVIGGLVVMAVPSDPYPRGIEGPPGNFLVAGWVFSAALGLASVGIPLWAGGSWAARSFEHLKTPVQVSFSAAPTRDGASAQLNFTF